MKIKKILKLDEIYTLHHQSDRIEFLKRFLFVIGMGLVLAMLMLISLKLKPTSNMLSFALIVALIPFALALHIAGLTITIHRLRDIGIGWLSIPVAFIIPPILGMLPEIIAFIISSICFAFLCLCPGIYTRKTIGFFK